MRLPRLRCSDSGGCIRRKSVALQHGDMFEVVGDSTRRRQAGYPGANDDCLPTDQCGSHHCLSSLCRGARGRHNSLSQPRV
jgi:hypothetical protein